MEARNPRSPAAGKGENVMNLRLKCKVYAALTILRKYVPTTGYRLAFSGGKDSCVCERLLKMAGVRYQKYYHNVTMDPPELVRFIQTYHSDSIWINSKWRNMMHRLANRPSLPPTRMCRWCCDEFKHGSKILDKEGVVVTGVRREESFIRSKRELYCMDPRTRQLSLNIIVDWTLLDVWEFIESYQVPYCSLYDEGFDRLGCVGCPLAGTKQQDIEFDRWPRYEQLWHRAILKNWENYHDKLKRNGELYMHSKFESGESLWRWWRSGGKIR